jgi:hypothetical protein
MPREVNQRRRAVVEEFYWPVDGASGMGSFDFVRLAPHCAQDDIFYLINFLFNQFFI